MIYYITVFLFYHYCITIFLQGSRNLEARGSEDNIHHPFYFSHICGVIPNSTQIFQIQNTDRSGCLEIFHWMRCQVKKKKEEKTPGTIETNHELLFFYFEIGKLQPHLQLAGMERNTCAFYQRGVFLLWLSKRHLNNTPPN